MKHYLLSLLTVLTLSLSLPSFAADAGNNVQPIDINTASVEQITAIKGIGPKKAEAIVAERTANGPFKDAEDLTRVKGIGEATANKLRDQLSFE